MADPDSAPQPNPRPAVPPGARRPMSLSLPRRTPAAANNHGTGGLISLAYAGSDADLNRRVEQRINSRSPFPNVGGGAAPAATAAERARIADLERTLRQREQELDAREQALVELQGRLGERERELAELENLLLARERVLMAQRKAPTAPPFPVSEEEKQALEKLRAELDAQEAALAEHKAALREREIFIEQSETTLLNKVASQQEHEILLEQREEDLQRAETDLRQRLAEIDPAAAARLEAERNQPRNDFAE